MVVMSHIIIGQNELVVNQTKGQQTVQQQSYTPPPSKHLKSKHGTSMHTVRQCTEHDHPNKEHGLPKLRSTLVLYYAVVISKLEGWAFCTLINTCIIRTPSS